MNEWTPSAKARLETYFNRVRERLKQSGADVNEVVDDLRRHVNEEIAAMKLIAVTEHDVGQILLRIGAPEVFALDPPPSAVPAAKKENRSGKKAGGFLLFFGVILPLGTIALEFITGVCAGILFDPIPSFIHLLLALSVPVINLILWQSLRTGETRNKLGLGLASGFALAISGVYAALLIPSSPFAAIGIIYFGLGLIPLAPLFAFISAAVLRGRFNSRNETRLPGLGRGLALGVASILLATAPMVITRIGLHMSASDSKRDSNRGIGWLRTCGSREEMLRACYGRVGEMGDLYSFGSAVNAEKAREVYFRVTGKPFNSVPPPKLYAGRSRWSVVEDEFTWDNDQGGDAVAGRVRGLSLKSSRSDAVVDPAGAVVYVEWTLDFANVSGLQREARAQILLPPGGVVSRLTLWIDGEEREAAFGGRTRVKSAYKEVVSRRRDPVLVTTCGPDRVLLQCFPVQPKGGTMKARIGITAPIQRTSQNAGTFEWPRILERNFSLQQDFRHTVWIESKEPLENVAGKFNRERTPSGIYCLRAQLSDHALENASSCISVRLADATAVQATDTRAGERFQIQQQTIQTNDPSAGSIVVVLDGARNMGASFAAIGEAMKTVPVGSRLAVLLAHDGVEDISGGVKVVTTELTRELSRRIQKLKATGGQDNVPALVRAWDLAAQNESGRILWIHGPQPVLLEGGEDLLQRLQRRPDGPMLLELQTENGPNRLLEKLDGTGTKSLRLAGAGAHPDFQSALRQAFGGQPRQITARTRVEQTQGTDLSLPEASNHIVRLWAAEESSRLSSKRNFDAATKLAQEFQIVTPMTGAVVLESQAQYRNAGLQPVSPASVPSVPEPGTIPLVLAGLALFRWMRNAAKTSALRTHP